MNYPRQCDMSPREKQLLEMLIGTAEDIANIAHRLGVTHGTAKMYATRIYEKVGVSGRIELMSREIQRLREAVGNANGYE